MRYIKQLLLICCAVVPLPSLAQDIAPLAKEFVGEMVQKHNFDRQELAKVFAKLKVNTKVIQLIKPPEAGGRQVWWDEYRDRHMDWLSLNRGARFLNKHAELLAKAEQQYGVPANIIAAIIGVETRYGNFTGNFLTVEALASLAFAYPPRAEYFRGELEQLLLYAREQNVAVTSFKGSYAGALGYSQFMPTSVRNWAVDLDQNGDTDLFNFADAIGSVANFLKEHGWVANTPVAFAVEPLANAQPDKLLAAGIIPTLYAANFADAGMEIEFENNQVFQGELALVDLENEDSTEYRAGTINYYVLTRYNRSNKYAMTVLDVANRIQEMAN